MMWDSNVTGNKRFFSRAQLCQNLFPSTSLFPSGSAVHILSLRFRRSDSFFPSGSAVHTLFLSLSLRFRLSDFLSLRFTRSYSLSLSVSQIQSFRFSIPLSLSQVQLFSLSILLSPSGSVVQNLFLSLPQV